MKKLLVLLISFNILWGIQGYSQSNLDSLIALYVSEFDSAGLIYFHPNTLAPGQLYAMYYTETGDSLHKLELKRQWTDSVLGLQHFRYQETYRNLRVEAAEYTEHAQGAYLVFANGKGAQFDGDRSAEPVIGEEEALTILLGTMPDYEFAWKNEEWEDDLKNDLDNPEATYYPEGELMFALVDYKNLTWKIPSNKYKLAWRFDILSLNPSFHKAYYVDGYTGAIFREEQLRHNNGPANILTQGTQTIDTRWQGGLFPGHILWTNDNNRDIHTKYEKNGAWGLRAEIKDGNGNWGNDEQFGTTAHWMVTQAWDFFASPPYNRNGLDGAGKELRVEADSDEENAFYDEDGKRDYIIFGSISNRYLAILDVAGHEFTHGVDNYTADLVYQDESGALDESFADIFGFMVERFAEGGVSDWLIGEDALILRSIANPKSQGSHYPNATDCSIVDIGQPNTFGGDFWFVGTCDNGGVHTNSGVQNFWFRLLAEGGIGINDNGDNYNLQGIGIDNAALIAYWSHTNILQSGSQYNDARAGSIAAATLLFGNCSVEEIQTQNAWAAVGVGNQSICGITNIPTVSEKNPVLFPNPFTDEFTITFSDSKARMLQLYSLNGSLIERLGNYLSSEIKISKAHLAKGIYILKIKENEQVYTVKLIKI